MTQVQNTKMQLAERSQLISDKEEELENEREQLRREREKMVAAEWRFECHVLIKEMIQIVELQDVENTLRRKFEVQLGETESEHQR